MKPYDELMNMIQTDIGSGAYDGYVIAPLQADTVATLIKDTDKPIMALDSKINSDKVISFIGTGNEEAAKAGATAAVEAAKAAGWEEIKCIEIAGVQGDGTNTARMNGYIAGVNENGGEFLENEVHYANAVADLATNEMEGIMSTHPEGIAIICANNDDMALAAANAAAKAVLIDAKMIIMDEPTSSLGEKEVEQLMKTCRELKGRGIGIVFVSHKLEELFELCDRVVVMREGEVKAVVDRDSKHFNQESLMKAAWGGSLDE